MNDRELLELAAKAVGYKVVDWTRTIDGDFTGLVTYETGTWNPLTDDGDALRLAVKLIIDIFPPRTEDDCSRVKAFEHDPIFVDQDTNNPTEATRRAIVRAAAEIGKDMS